jgi:leader peptidase (prepilin peptidase) / N-methyltransferase
VLQLLIVLYAGLVGLIVGSYLNVVVYRLPLGLSTVRPRSRCPGCGNLIRARDNVPVLSFLLLRGRCRHCDTRISWRYPLVELTTAGLFVACLFRYGFSLQTPVAWIFAGLMLVLGLIDFDHMLLPDRLTLPGIAIGLATQLRAPLAGLVPALIGAAVGAGILLAAWGLWKVVRHEEGMGLGDVKMLALVGAFLGWQGVLVTLLCSTLGGSVVGLALMRHGSHDMRSRLPFGVFLALGGLAALFFGDPLIAWYTGLL